MCVNDDALFMVMSFFEMIIEGVGFLMIVWEISEKIFKENKRKFKSY
jgi:hypothetical protein